MDILYCSAIVFSVAQSAAAKFYNRKSDDAAFFNAFKALAALIVSLFFLKHGFVFHVPTVLYGACYGLMLCLSMYAGFRALCLGPMALTGMIVSFSVLLPLGYGVVFQKEPLSVLKIIGFVLFAAALVLTALGKTGGSATQGGGEKWALFVGLTFVSNGACSILQKIHQSIYPEEYCGAFMFYSGLVCCILFIARGLMQKPLKAYVHAPGKLSAAAAGAAGGASNLCTLFLAGSENASVMYPVISAGTILVSLVCGRVLFGEKIRPLQIPAFLCGICAIVLLKL